MARHFTLEEARRGLRLIEPVLRDAVRLKRQYDKAVEDLSVVLASGADEEREASEARLKQLRDDIVERVRFIAGNGVQLKDLDTGLIDFPTMRDGHQVLLCWRLGEPGIGFWHTEEEGYPGRRPV